MSGILCAVRGGDQSATTIEEAIAVAQNHELPLFFLHVIDLVHLLGGHEAQLAGRSQEMMEEGEFILLRAQTMAQHQGLRAHGLARTGEIGEQIYALCLELEADYVLLGKPGPDDQHNVFDPPALEALKRRIESETQTKLLTAGASPPG